MKKKVLKMGRKLGFNLSNMLHYGKGDLTQIVIRKNNSEEVFLTKFNRIVNIRRQVERSLDLKVGDIVDIEMDKIENTPRVRNIFCNNKIDLLALVPHKTSGGYEIVVTEFTKSAAEWLRLWYSHPRGSGRQLEIKRFVDIEKFGALLGQYQAEGTKESKKYRNYKVEFCNKLVEEHVEFHKGLLDLGIKEELIFGELIYNLKYLNRSEARQLIKKYERNVTKIKTSFRTKHTRGGYGFRTKFSSTVFWELFCNAMDTIRKRLAYKIETKEEKLLASSFLAKLLTGDGTLDSRTFNREFLDVRIIIVDQNLEYLEDYRSILRNVGFFNPKLNEKYIWVRTSCSFENLLYLYDIGAFKNTGNWNKLIVSIALCLRGRRINTYYRFLELSKLSVISSLYFSHAYKVTIQSAWQWLENKEKEGLLIQIASNPSALYKITRKGYGLTEILSKWQTDYDLLQATKNISNNPALLLSSLKIKN